jgi:CubicO group peptidase (beta-lactamase class C family)
MRLVVLSLLLLLVSAAVGHAGDRVPGEHWMRFVDPAEAGFDAAALDAARESWEALPSSAFLVVADGAVVAAWGDVERRFMCHSVRKSFLSALYGIYWDRGELELNKTMAELGIDDEPEPLLDIEKEARILDLLKARSAVYHPAAYAGRTDSRPRGSVRPGQAFGYNNWDFNTLATILMQETGDDVFEAFDEHFGQPLGMQDWRIRHGYYHYERDKSKYPAYPFRLSARDAARFGLLFARRGLWGDERILSKHWVNRSTALYSIDDRSKGYGFMWWVYREPPFASHGMVAALGVGNQMIAALPESDLVMVNRANTYEGQRTPTPGLMDLVEQVLAARTGTPSDTPRLVVIEDPPPPDRPTVPPERFEELVGDWPHPPGVLGGDGPVTTVSITVEDDHLLAHIPINGTFRMDMQPDGSLIREDVRDRVFVVRNDAGEMVGIADLGLLISAALRAGLGGDVDQADAFLDQVVGDPPLRLSVARACLQLVRTGPDDAVSHLRTVAATDSDGRLESTVNTFGYALLQSGARELARDLFRVNVRLHPHAANTWDSLGEALQTLGDVEEALEAYETALTLDPENTNAALRIVGLRSRVESATEAEHASPAAGLSAPKAGDHPTDQ